MLQLICSALAAWWKAMDTLMFTVTSLAVVWCRQRLGWNSREEKRSASVGLMADARQAGIASVRMPAARGQQWRRGSSQRSSV